LKYRQGGREGRAVQRGIVINHRRLAIGHREAQFKLPASQRAGQRIRPKPAFFAADKSLQRVGDTLPAQPEAVGKGDIQQGRNVAPAFAQPKQR